MRKKGFPFLIAVAFSCLFSAYSFAKDQPFYIVTNDNAHDLVELFSGFSPNKPRSVVSPDAAANNRQIKADNNPGAEETSVFLVNRSKPGDFDEFANMFNVDYTAGGPKQVTMAFSPKGGKNPNFSILISANDRERLKIGIIIFLEKWKENSSKVSFSFTNTINDCLVYNDFEKDAYKIGKLEFHCPERYFSRKPEEIQDFLKDNKENNEIYILNSLNLPSVPDEIKSAMGAVFSQIKPCSFFVKYTGKSDDAFALIIAAPSVSALKREMQGQRADRIPAEGISKVFPDFRKYRTISVQQIKNLSGWMPGVEEKIRSIIQSHAYALRAFENADKAKSDIIIVGEITSLTGYVSYGSDKNRITPVPTPPAPPPKKPEQTYEDCELFKCKTKSYTDEQYEQIIKQYNKTVIDYNIALDQYNNQMAYGSYIWAMETSRESRATLSGTLKIISTKTNEVLYSAPFSGQNSRSNPYDVHEEKVMGANNEPPLPRTPPPSDDIEDDMVQYIMESAITSWFDKMEENVILPTGEVALASSAPVPDIQADMTTADIIEIEGKLVVIDKGKADGIRSDMKFMVVTKYKEYKDLKTGKVLDKEPSEKVFLKVKEIRDNITFLYVAEPRDGLKKLKIGMQLSLIK